MVTAVPIADSTMMVPVTRPELYCGEGLKNSCASRDERLTVSSRAIQQPWHLVIIRHKYNHFAFAINILETFNACQVPDRMANFAQDLRMNILLVEDEPKVADFIRKGLKEQSYNVDMAYDGLFGEKLALENEYDLAIVDVILP